MRGRRLVAIAGGLVLGVVFGLAAGLPSVLPVAAQAPVTITLGPQNNSGITGTAVLTPQGTRTRVLLTIKGGPAGGNHPAHIHAGTCANLNPRPAFPLANVQNGSSETLVNASIQQILAAQHAINVHKSPQEASVYVACGDLPVGAPASASPPAARSGPAQPAGMPRTGGGGAPSPWLGLAGLVVLAGLALRRR
jgi:MYXO-CTERM domain-containing protein